MDPCSAPDAQPTAAERIRSVLAAAHSMTVVSDGRHAEVHRLDELGAMGHVHLHAPGGDSAHPSNRRVPIRLELTDIAPVPVRDRVRARVTLTGLVEEPYHEGSTESICMEFGQAVLEDPKGRSFVTLEALESSRPDPLATYGANMLTHLVDDHGELVTRLIRLVHPRPAAGVTRAMPVGMDRYGITLRLEYPDRHRDARLLFPTPVTEADQAGPQIHALLSAARRACHPNRLPS
ncbi:DUF2470 domain-containing protein [Streptomyces sp. NPDC006879]|uniref:DUF2470 domain-containing protein n=1 Tax=Streptomyces sp. NPDC006879 TaxID=3364767 RepID=UPI00367FE327